MTVFIGNLSQGNIRSAYLHEKCRALGLPTCLSHCTSEKTDVHPGTQGLTKLRCKCTFSLRKKKGRISFNLFNSVHQQSKYLMALMLFSPHALTLIAQSSLHTFLLSFMILINICTCVYYQNSLSWYMEGWLLRPRLPSPGHQKR